MLNWSIILMFLFNCVDARYPGARLILTPKALEYVSSLMIPLLEKEFLVLKVPDISDTTRVKVIGKIEYTISNIHFEGFSVTSSSISSSTDGVTLQLSNIALKSVCNWKYKKRNRWVRFSDHGSVEIKIKNAAIVMTVLVTKSVDGHPVMKTTKCEANLPSLSIKLHGGASWLFNLFHGKLERELKSSLRPKLCDYVYAADAKLNSAISSYPLSKTVNDFTITYGLLNDPVFSSNQIQFDLKYTIGALCDDYQHWLYSGRGIVSTTSDDIPLQSVVLPAVENTDKMIYLLLTDKVFVTAVTAAIHSGLLHYTISADQLSSELKLTTMFFKPVVPKLFKQFPNSPVALAIDFNNYKEIYLNLAGVHISLLGNLLLQVIQENETTFDAFSVELEVHCTIEADILQPNDKPAVLLEATDLRLTLGKLTSSIGDFEIASLEPKLDGMFYLLMLIVNEYGRNGFTIPSMDRVKFINPSITLRKDCMQVSMDFKYS